ncbi:hypothetical protein IWX50DRAFT_387474 [Phyllosticta citricarpa]
MQFAFTLTSRERLDAYSAKKQTLMESVLCSSWPRSSSPVARATQISFNTSLLVALARNLKERDTEILAAIGIFYQRGAKVNFHGSYEKFTPLLGSLGRLVNIQYHKKGPCVVIKLLEIGADPNLPVPYGENDFEPLGPAFIYGNTETIGILVHAAAVLLRSHFCTESTLKLLLQSNLRVDVNAAYTKIVHPPLNIVCHCATSFAINTIGIVLEAGTDPNLSGPQNSASALIARAHTWIL